jgi:hypothetical protein
MEILMLEHYYVKPSTIDRIRDSWLGSQIESYVGWMEANGYSSRTVFRRLPRLFCFAEFAQKRSCTDVASAFALVEEFVSEWLVQHGAEAKTSASLRKHAIDIGMPHVRCYGWPLVAGYGIIVTAAHFHLKQRFLGSKSICAMNAD